MSTPLDYRIISNSLFDKRGVISFLKILKAEVIAGRCAKINSTIKSMYRIDQKVISKSAKIRLNGYEYNLARFLQDNVDDLP